MRKVTLDVPNVAKESFTNKVRGRLLIVISVTSRTVCAARAK